MLPVLTWQSMVPLFLQGGLKEAPVWTFPLYICGIRKDQRLGMSPCVLYMVITPKDIWKVGN